MCDLRFTYRLFAVLILSVMTLSPGALAKTALIIDHNCTQLSQIPSQWIDSAKNSLRIAYGHTSHGSQITDGMSGLVSFANGGGKGLSLPTNSFDWNDGGTGEALYLHDYAMGGDVGYYPDWVNNTKDYLNDPAHTGVNVVMWSWCGQVGGKYANGTLFSEFLEPMNQLEHDYPNVKFVYMTGHLDHWDDVNNKAANDSIRRYCQREGKILYDFADIESYDPDGTFFEYAGDDCSYYKSDGTYMGNWAEEWRASHTENIDWYTCGSAHSDPLNANQKAYAAWWLWARLAGWNVTTEVEEPANVIPCFVNLSQNYPNPFNPTSTICYQIPASLNFSQGGYLVTLKVFDLLGRVVATLVNEEKPPGKYHVEFDGTNLSSGIYFYRLRVGGFNEVKKMQLIK